MWQRIQRLVIALAAGATLAACTDQGTWRTENIDGLVPALELAMTDDAGRAVSAETYRGRTVLLFFGYTHCPDVCPTTLARLAQALGATQSRGAGTVVLFVTVDPRRDTVERLHEYVRAFGPWFVGLRGTPDETRALAKRYRVTFSYGEPDKSGDYEVTHSTGVFVFDGGGRSRLLILPRDPVEAISADLDRLTAGGS
jgi:protein SCO1/2